jgi:hypothetical protein
LQQFVLLSGTAVCAAVCANLPFTAHTKMLLLAVVLLQVWRYRSARG